MIPDPDEVSAFAVYSGLAGISKSKKRRNRMKKHSGSQEDDNKSNRKSSTESKKAKVMKKKKTSNGSPKVGKIIKPVKNKIKVNKANNIKKKSSLITDDEPSSEASIDDTFKTKKSGRRSSLDETGKKEQSSYDTALSPPNGSFILNKTAKGAKTGKRIQESEDQPLYQENGSLIVNKTAKGAKTGKRIQESEEVKIVKKKKRNVTPVQDNSCRSENDSESDTENSQDLSNDLISKTKDERVRKKNKLSPPSRMMRVRPSPSERNKLLLDEVRKLVKGKSSSNSVQKGKIVLESLISPFNLDNFFSEYWEKKPLLVDRGGDCPIFSQYLSSAEIDTMLRYNTLQFGRNIDITSYCNGVRETHNPEGRAHPHVVWDYYSNGCSVRILNPQTYLPKVHTLLASMQEYFGCFVGSNIYLTPPNTQGFAPHYDDIEAFVLQIEGSKRWRVYRPKSPEEELPRYSSRNFNQDEIGNPILDVILRPGDTLYFPRGYIHQAEALPDQHSLHITISTYQKTSWLDLIEKALPVALARASEDNIDYRRGLPIGYLRAGGLAHPSGPQRLEMLSKLKKLIFHLEKHLDIDDAIDKLAIPFVHQSLPPILTQEEAKCSVHNGGLKMTEGNLTNRVDISLSTKLRWVRANAVRIVEDDDEGQVRLYHSVDNSKEYEGEEIQYVVIDKEMLPALIHLVRAYPAYTSVSQLPFPTNDEKLVLVGDLWDRGLLVSDNPLGPVED